MMHLTNQNQVLRRGV